MAINPIGTSTLTARWEYLTLNYTYNYGSTSYEINGEKEIQLKNRPLHEVLTLLGQAGWELVGVMGAEGRSYVFKRQGVRKVEMNGSQQKA